MLNAKKYHKDQESYQGLKWQLGPHLFSEVLSSSVHNAAESVMGILRLMLGLALRILGRGQRPDTCSTCWLLFRLAETCV